MVDVKIHSYCWARGLYAVTSISVLMPIEFRRSRVSCGGDQSKEAKCDCTVTWRGSGVVIPPLERVRFA